MGELVKTQEGALSTIGNVENGGLQSSDFELPRVLLLQNTSPDLNENPQLRAGMFINNVTKEQVVPKFVPLFAFKQYAEFTSEGNLVWSTQNKNDERVVNGLKWGNSGDPEKDKPPVTEFLNLLCLFDGCSVPLILSFKRTALKIGRQFLTKMMMKPGGVDQMYSFKYAIDTVRKSKGAQTWYVPKITDIQDREEHVTSDEKKAEYLALARKYMAVIKNVPVVDDSPEEEVPF